jgi:hypothetical protein
VAAVERVRMGTPQGTQFVDVRWIAADDAGAMPLRERIARTNLATVERMGLDRMKAVMDDIIEDRQRAYEGLT